MNRSRFRVPRSLFVAAVLVVLARPAAAHPVPFSYIDVRVDGRIIEVSVVAHAWDLIHDLNLGPETTDERFLDSATLQAQASAIAALFGGRLRVEADGQTLIAGPWSAPEALMDRLSVRMRAQYEAVGPPGVVRVSAVMFPYDPVHQTFLNVYEGGQLSAQAILSV